jgi:hypothetical protein
MPDAAPIAIGQGLVGYWKLDEPKGTTAVDSSGNNNNGRYWGSLSSPNIAPVMFADPASRQFTQSLNQKIVVPDSPAVSLTGPMTISAWVWPLDSLRQQQVVDKWNGAGYMLRLDIDEKPKFLIGNSAGKAAEVDGSLPVPMGKWTHIAAVFDGTYLRLYVNGVSGTKRSAYGVLPADGTNALGIGDLATGGHPFGGNIDDVRLYNRALTTAEVLALAQGN